MGLKTNEIRAKTSDLVQDHPDSLFLSLAHKVRDF